VEVADERSLGQVIEDIGRFAGGMTSKQKLVLMAGAAAVGLTLWLFVGVLGEPHYAVLYSGLRAQDAASLSQRLAARNIPSRASPDGASLLVPLEQMDAARLETASQGLPRNARLGFELFDTPNWAGSDFSEKVNYQRALEGELERTLETLGDVEAVRVHVVLPEDSLFSEREREAKAAVIVKTRGGRLAESAQAAIPQLVASAVDRLRPENVTVIDADSQQALPHASGAGTHAGGLAPDQELAASLISTLEPVVGVDHVRVSVHAEYDPSSSEESQETYDPKATAALSQQRSDEASGAPAAAGIPGTASNVPGAQPTGVALVSGADSEHQTSHSESTTFAVSKNVRHMVAPAGRLRRITAAVLVDDAVEWTEDKGKKTETRRKRTADELKQIEQLARAAVGADTARGDLLVVENIAFRRDPVTTPVAPGWPQRVRQLLTNWAGLLRYAALGALFLVVYLLLLRPLKKEALTAFRQLPARAAKGSGAVSQDALPAGLEPNGDEVQRAAALRKQLTAKVSAEPKAASRLVQGWMREKA
jgi:flagellar M-ring protein FliF